MRIAQISTLATRVGPTDTGSIEGLVWLLSRELSRLGHELTVFAAAGSELSGGELVETLPGPYGYNGAPDDWQLCEWMGLCRAVNESGRFDVVHSHNYLWGISLENLCAAPMVHTLHVTPADDQHRLLATQPGACVTAISRWQWSDYADVNPFAVVHHGVDSEQFAFHSSAEDYVCYLGRFVPGKGPLKAIETARKLGMPLLMAGPANDYYHRKVKPAVDGTAVRYVGMVGGERRCKLLGGAKALLYPVQAPEPFGLVIAEAMMCGTPVAAMRIGAVPELIEEGVTGYTAESPEEFADTVGRCLTLDRCRVRERAESRFCARRMAREYEHVYQQLLERRRRGGAS